MPKCDFNKVAKPLEGCFWLTEVQRLTHNAMPHILMTDFESVMLSVLNEIYPGIPQVRCLLHLAKNIFKLVQTLDESS